MLIRCAAAQALIRASAWAAFQGQVRGPEWYSSPLHPVLGDFRPLLPEPPWLCETNFNGKTFAAASLLACGGGVGEKGEQGDARDARTWARAPVDFYAPNLDGSNNPELHFGDQTLRQSIRISVGGQSVYWHASSAMHWMCRMPATSSY